MSAHGQKLRRTPTKALAAVLLMLTAGCKTTDFGGTSACSQWRSVSWSAKDTPSTVDEVKSNNARRSAYCNRG